MKYYYQYSSASPALTTGVSTSPTQNLPSASGSLQPANPYTATDLTTQTTYWYRLVAETGGQTLYGPILSFFVGGTPVTVQTNPATNVNAPVLNSATLNGNYTYGFSYPAVRYFEYSLDQTIATGVTRVPSPGTPITLSLSSQPATSTVNNLPPGQVRRWLSRRRGC